MQLFIVDDDPLFRSLVNTVFTDAGHQVLSAPSGADAIVQAKTLRPDIVLLDLTMPGESGLDILPQLRASEGWDAIPILMLTADDNMQNLIDAGRRGARGYLCKPIQPSILIKMVDEVLTNPDITWIDDYSKVRRAAPA